VPDEMEESKWGMDNMEELKWRMGQNGGKDKTEEMQNSSVYFQNWRISIFCIYREAV
jgi:hypothetical protein